MATAAITIKGCHRAKKDVTDASRRPYSNRTPTLTTMDGEDPITQFFPGKDSVDLYAVLALKSDAKLEDIKKSYRRHALIYHPDKHASSSDTVKNDASTKFQQIGFAYAVLSDGKRKTRYDRTGKTDEGFEMAGEDGWEAYFEEMFERVTRGKLDEMKKDYQGEHYDLYTSRRDLLTLLQALTRK
jgi:DnaJ-class molecular chaperone